MTGTRVQLTDKQELFLDTLFGEGEGSLRKTAEICGIGITSIYKMNKALQEEITERAKYYLALHGPKATQTLIDLMGNDKDVGATAPGALIKLKAAQAVLDRIGIAKQDGSMNIKVDGANGIFILPAKKEITIDAIKDVDYERQN